MSEGQTFWLRRYVRPTTALIAGPFFDPTEVPCDVFATTDLWDGRPPGWVDCSLAGTLKIVSDFDIALPAEHARKTMPLWNCTRWPRKSISHCHESYSIVVKIVSEAGFSSISSINWAQCCKFVLNILCDQICDGICCCDTGKINEYDKFVIENHKKEVMQIK